MRASCMSINRVDEQQAVKDVAEPNEGACVCSLCPWRQLPQSPTLDAGYAQIECRRVGVLCRSQCVFMIVETVQPRVSWKDSTD